MPLYNFVKWEDETGATIATTPTLTYTVTSDKTFRAVYQIAMRNVTYQSTPVPINGLIDTTPLPSGSVVQVQDSAQITITVPAQIEVS